MTENKILDSTIGKTIKSVEIGWCGFDDAAICMTFTDGTAITYSGKHDENTAVYEGNAIED